MEYELGSRLDRIEWQLEQILIKIETLSPLKQEVSPETTLKTKGVNR